MKIKFIAAAVAAASFASCGTSVESVITCTTTQEALEGEMFYLGAFKSEGRSSVSVDSAVVTNGKLEFHCSTAAPEARIVSRGRQRVYVILEGDSINIDLDSKKVDGGALNATLTEYSAAVNELDKTIRTQYNAVRSDSTLAEDDREAILDSISNVYDMESTAINRKYLSENLTNPVGQLVFWWTAAGADVEEYKELKASVTDYILNFGPAKAVDARFVALENTKVGSKFVDFQIKGGAADSTDVAFSDFVGKGKYVLVDFWASWCGPCRREMKYIKAVYEKYACDKFDVLSVAVWDERAASEKAAADLGMTWNHIFDAQEIPTEIYGINGIPHLMLIDPEGIIVSRDELRGEKIAPTVAAALGLTADAE